MVATSPYEPEVRCSPTWYTGTYETLQRKSPTKPTRSNKGASRSGQGVSNQAEADPVRSLLVIATHVRIAHVLLGASSEHSATSRGREDPYDGARTFFDLRC